MNTKNLKSSNIKHKTMFYLILFSVFIILLLWESQILFSDYLYEKYQIKDMAKIAEEIHTKNADELHNYLKNVVYNNAVCIEYIDIYGYNKLYNDASTGCLLGRDNAEFNQYMTSLYESDEEIKAIKLVNPDYKSSALLYGIKVSNGYIFLFTMLSNVNKNYTVIKDQLLYVAIVVIILAIIISLFLAKVISEPIVSITEKSKLLASGNYNIEFEHHGIKEIDELADTLNYLESEVSKTDQYRRDLMANVSHDLKTPLTMIKAYAEMVRDITYKNKEKRNANLNVIIEETDRLNLLVSDILSLSKLQANSDIIEIETFDLSEEMHEILKRYNYLEETEGYKFILSIPEKAIIRADKNKINQVIYNLINNAINYTGQDKTVYIDIKEEKKSYMISIKDTGKGIEKDKIDYIWDKRNIVGTGLGLSIVKNILEVHNFEYGVKSIKNKGTTFYFKINKLSNIKNNNLKK